MKAHYDTLGALEQELFSQDHMNLHALLSLSSDKIYTAADLEEEEVLERALRLLVHARNGQASQHVRMGPHITYDKLLREVTSTIAAKLEVEEVQLKQYMAAYKPL